MVEARELIGGVKPKTGSTAQTVAGDAFPPRARRGNLGGRWKSVAPLGGEAIALPDRLPQTLSRHIGHVLSSSPLQLRPRSPLQCEKSSPGLRSIGVQ